MTTVQRIQIKMSETREALNGLTAPQSAEDISRRETLSAEHQALEVELRAAIAAEGAASTSHRVPGVDGPYGTRPSVLVEIFDERDRPAPH